jgi:biopolymer transport protein ExbD
MRLPIDLPQPRPLAAMLPLVHLVMLVLITWMVVTPAIATHTRLPRARTAMPAMKDRVTVAIDDNGGFWIAHAADPGPIRSDQMARRLGEAYAGRAGEELYLIADQRVEYAWVQRVLAAASQAGVREVQLIAECPRDRESLMRHCRP